MLAFCAISTCLPASVAAARLFRSNFSPFVEPGE
jgi:hypothetical protein